MISFPWDSIVEGFDEETGFPLYDRGYTAEQLREVMMTFFSNGVFSEVPEAFVTKASDGMSVTLTPGRCFIQGDVGVEKSVRTMAFSAATSQPRYDTIVLRWDNSIDARSIDLYVKQGVAADKPVRPSLTRGETVWELGICDIFIPAGSTKITQDRITDTRLETSRCGIVNPFNTVDTTKFFEQIQAAIDARSNELKEQTDKAIELAQSALDGTIAGNLQNQIDGRVKKTGDRMSGALNLDIPLAIESGGTGASTARNARWNLKSFYSLATDVTNGEENDTNTFWREHESGIYYFSKKEQIKGQPSTYGYLINIKPQIDWSFAIQIWLAYDDGVNNKTGSQIWTRTSNINSNVNVFTDWRKHTTWSDIYPIGAVYISYSSTSPASLFGGSWTQITDKFIRAANDVNTGGSNSSVAYHRHLNLPGVTSGSGKVSVHSGFSYDKSSGAPTNNLVRFNADTNGTYVVPALTYRSDLYSTWATGATSSSNDGENLYTQYTGTQNIGNMPEYQDLYVWRRTA